MNRYFIDSSIISTELSKPTSKLSRIRFGNQRIQQVE